MMERSRRHRGLLTLVGWLGATVLATAVTLAAVSSIGSGIFGDAAGPLDQGEVEQALATLTPAETASPEPEPTTAAPGPGSATGTPEASPLASVKPEVITSPGGNVLAQCVGGRAELVSWSPAQGYHVDSVDRRPSRTAEIEFEAEHRDVEIRVRCVDGVPEATVDVDD